MVQVGEPHNRQRGSLCPPVRVSLAQAEPTHNPTYISADLGPSRRLTFEFPFSLLESLFKSAHADPAIPGRLVQAQTRGGR